MRLLVQKFAEGNCPFQPLLVQWNIGLEYQLFMVRHRLDEALVLFHNFLQRLHVPSWERSSHDRSISCCCCVICRLTAHHAVPQTEAASRCRHWHPPYFHSGVSLSFSANAVDMAFQKWIQACVFIFFGDDGLL